MERKTFRARRFGLISTLSTRYTAVVTPTLCFSWRLHFGHTDDVSATFLLKRVLLQAGAPSLGSNCRARVLVLAAMRDWRLTVSTNVVLKTWA